MESTNIFGKLYIWTVGLLAVLCLLLGLGGCAGMPEPLQSQSPVCRTNGAFFVPQDQTITFYERLVPCWTKRESEI